MASASPVLEKDVVLSPVAIRLADQGVKPLVVLRNTLQVMLQLLGGVTAFQFKLIWLEETADAVKPVGARWDFQRHCCHIFLRSPKIIWKANRCRS